MPALLRFPDAAGATDLLTFAGRTTALGSDAAIRLQARAGILAATAAVLAPDSAGAAPTVLALRAMRVDPDLECDLVVTAAGLAPSESSERAVTLPETAVTAPWAGLSPPRSGWREAGRMPAAALQSAAAVGAAQVAAMLPADPGEAVVHAARTAVWGEPDPALANLPRGVAFAAHQLGFAPDPDETAVIRENAGWTRVSLRRGDVLVRRTVRFGLTPVRGTGGGR